MKSTRPKIILVTIYIFFILILAKLFYLQVIKGQFLRDKSVSQLYKLNKIIPQQGHILSSDNFPLSLDYSYYTASLYKPNFKKDIKEIINEINNIKPEFSSENAILLEKFNNPNQKWMEFLTHFDYSEMQSLAKIDGIDFSLKQSRYYPNHKLFLGLIMNLERYYRRQISGQIGFSRSIIDGTGENLLTRKNWQKNEIDGQDIRTTLNRQIQFLSENILKKGIDTYQADSASLAIIQPQSGELLALASVEASPSSQITKIPNISNTFEPGSIFKPLVMSAALDTNKIDQDYTCQKCDRPRIIGQYTINNWDNQFHANSSLQDIIKNSDNIGMSYIIEQLGLNNFLDYFHRLKLDQKTVIELSGESISNLKKDWPDIDLATASFGQGFAINQLQMLQAFNAIANNGQLVKIHLNKQSKIETSTVFQPNTMAIMRQILHYAVNNSPVASLKPKDMDVCAKSGTAQVAIKGSYLDDNSIGSYIGFYPCENPKFTMIVTVNNPRLSQWGSSTAAPIWYDLAQKIEPLL